MPMESLTVTTVLMGEQIEFKKLRQCRRPYSNDAIMIPYSNDELGVGTIIIERSVMKRLNEFKFRDQDSLIKFLVNVSKASYEDRFKPLKYVNESSISVYRVKDETVILRLKQQGHLDTLIPIKPLRFDEEGRYEWLERVGSPEMDWMHN